MPPRQHQQQQSHHNQKQPGTKRLLVISSTVAYVLFFGKCVCEVCVLPTPRAQSLSFAHHCICVPATTTGIPVWWHTTSLHRPPLPHEAMQHVAATAASAATTTPTPTSTTGSSSSTAFLPVSLQVVAVLPAGAGAMHISTAALNRLSPCVWRPQPQLTHPLMTRRAVLLAGPRLFPFAACMQGTQLSS